MLRLDERRAVSCLAIRGILRDFGLVAIEAFACGTPVIASRSGAMQELVADGNTGLHLNPHAEDLAAKVNGLGTIRENESDGRGGS